MENYLRVNVPGGGRRRERRQTRHLPPTPIFGTNQNWKNLKRQGNIPNINTKNKDYVSKCFLYPDTKASMYVLNISLEANFLAISV
jgi:hypothetical protein